MTSRFTDGDLTGQLSNPLTPLCQLTEQDIQTPHDLSPEEVQPAGQIRRPTSRTSRPLKRTDIDALIAGYQAGKTVNELAAQLGIDRRTVSAHLRRAEIPIRRGGLDQKRSVEAARLYDAGWSSGRLAERFDVSTDTVLKTLGTAASSGDI